MSDKPVDLVQRLINAEEISPALRRSYQAELDAMLEPRVKLRGSASNVFLLAVLALFCMLAARNLLFADARPSVQIGWLGLMLASGGACIPVVRDLLRKKSSKKTMFSVTQLMSTAALLCTAMAMFRGMGAASEPSSTFQLLFTLVFCIACLFWHIDSRIAAAELASREQMLRLEYRLAELGDLLKGR